MNKRFFTRILPLFLLFSIGGFTQAFAQKAAKTSATPAATTPTTKAASYGPYNNNARATGTGAGSTSTTDDSNNGVEADINPLTASPTPVTFAPSTKIGIAKQAGTPVLQGNGSYNILFTVTIKNLGNSDLSNLVLNDDLTAVFTGGATYSMVSAGTAATGTLVANAAFNGNSNKALIATTSTLPAKKQEQLTFTVNVVPNGNFGIFNNQVTITADGQLGTTATDISDDGTNVDTDNDQVANEAGENDPTPISLLPNPIIGIAKSVNPSPVLKVDGSYDVTYTLVVKNLGNSPLNNVQVVDNMATTFTGATSFTVSSVTISGSPLTRNTLYNGNSNTNILAAGNTLPVNGKSTITVVVNVRTGANFGPYNNSAVATGNTPNPLGGTVNTTDTSNNGDETAINTATASATPITFLPAPQVGVALSASVPVRLANGDYQVTYTATVRNLGNTTLNSIQATDDLVAAFTGATSFTTTGTSVSGAGLVANAAFNGNANKNLLGAGSTLAAGASGTITFTVTLRTGGNFGPYNNQVNASALSPTAVPVSDVSHNGSNPDPNGNNNPNEAGESDPTPVSFTPNPVIGLAKSASVPVLRGNGSYDITYTVAVHNLGNAALSNIQVQENLNSTILAPSTFTVTGGSVTSGGLISNASFNGKTNIDLVSTGSTLAIGEVRTITFTVNIVPAGFFGPFSNSINASATGPGGLGSTSDISNDGNNPDLDNDKNPDEAGENNATVVSLSPNPVVGISKSASSSVAQGDGSYNVTYTFTVKNFGNINLTNISIPEDLTAVFTGGPTFTVTGGATATGNLVGNPSFNGNAVKELLQSSSILNVGEAATVSFVVNVRPNGIFGPFNNNVTVTAKGQGIAVFSTDVSTSGNNPDPNNNNKPDDTGENLATSVSFTPNPIIGLAKSIVSNNLNANNTYNVTYRLTVKNIGNIALENVQVVDDLTNVFTPAVVAAMVGTPTTTGSLVANAGYNGKTNQNLLAAGSTLAVGASADILFTLNLIPNGEFGPFNNSATASAKGLAIPQTTSDISDFGTDPDPNSNNNPNEPGENDATPVNLSPQPVIGLSKTVVSFNLQPNGSYNVEYRVTVKNIGNEDITGVQVTDLLENTIQAPSTFSVVSAPVATGNLFGNPAFTGRTTNTGLLNPTSFLNRNETQTINFTINVVTNSNFGPFNNTATATGTGKDSAKPTSDISNNGAIDPDNDLNPNEAGENTPTSVTLTPNPVIGISKNAATSSPLPGNNYNVTYTINVKNLGNIALSNVQVNDILKNTFPTPATYTISNITAAGLTLNPGFNGNTNTNLLAGTDGLALNETKTIIIDLIVQSNNSFGPFSNTASASATDISGVINTSDLSNNGAIDPNNNGNPSEASENNPTLISLTPRVIIGASKNVSSLVLKSNGSYDATFNFNVQNFGNIDLENVQLADNLDAVFNTSAATFTITGLTAGGSLVRNPAYNGTTDINLLAAGSTIPVGASYPVTLQINIVPNGSFGPFNNTATATAKGKNIATTTSDITAKGTNPDQNSNNDPTDGADNSVTDFNLAPNAVVGLAKAASIPVLQANGSYNTTFTVSVTNIGNINLRDVQVIDDLSLTFPSSTITMVGTPVATGGLVANTTYNGTGTAAQKQLLNSATSVLNTGTTQTITFTVNVDPNGTGTSFQNRASVSAVSVTGGLNTSDLSDDGFIADADGDKNPNEAGENDLTPITFTPNPRLGITKELTFAPSLQSADNSYNLTYTIRVFNLGNTVLNNVQLTDNLRNTFAGTGAITILSNSASGGLTVNPAFNGDSDRNLLDGTKSLARNASASIVLTINVKPNGVFGPFNNSVSGSAVDPAATVVGDLSDNGNNPDPNNNGNANEAGENDATPATFAPNGVVGAAKEVVSSVRKANGSYDVTYNIKLRNYGNIDLENVQSTDNLAAVFSGVEDYTILAAPTVDGNLVANAAFNGDANKNLLAAGSKLLAGATSNITFSINIVPNGSFGPFANDADVTAKLVGFAGTVSDLSVSGNNPDPDGNGAPTENSKTNVSLTPDPVLGLAESASAPSRNADGTYNVTYTIKAQNLGNVNLNNVLINQDLAATFSSSAATFTVVSAPVATGGLVVNPAFNGNTDKNLLLTSSTLVQATSQTIVFTIRITPNGSFGPFESQAFGTARDIIVAQNTSDFSNDGTITDNGNGIPNEAADNIKTIYSLTPNPVIAVAKNVSAPILQANGSYDITYTLTVQNLGNIGLKNVQVNDKIRVVFPAPAVYSIVNLTTTGTLVKNASFNGDVADGLLNAATSTLPVGKTETISLTVNVDAKGNFGPFNNQARAVAEGLNNVATADFSDNGLVPDANNNGVGNDAGEDDVTPVSFAPKVSVGASKQVLSNVLSGTDYNITFRITLKNYGNIALENVQATDNIIAAFPAPTIKNVIGSILTDGNLIANPGFNGNTNQNLLAAGSTLAIGEEAHITFTVRLNPNGEFGPFANQASVSAKGLGLPTITSDNSTDGNNADPDGDGNPTEQVKTPVNLSPKAIIGVAKTVVGSPQLQSNGTYNVTFSVKVQNLGNEDLNNVQVTDNINSLFTAPTTYTMVGGPVASGSLVANGAFNGNTNTALLNATSTLARGTSATVNFTINVNANGAFGPYNNTATGSGRGTISLLTATDISDNGTITDANNNLEPNETGENDATPFSLTPNPVIGLAETVGAAILNGDGTYNITYTIKVDNLGNTALTNVLVENHLKATFSGTSVYTITNVSTSGSLIKATDFNGDDKLNLLAAGSTLAKGASGTIQIDLKVDPKGNFGPFNNISSGRATDAAGTVTSDISDNGTISDANNNGNPTESGENDPTVISLTPDAVIGAAKVASVTLLGDGSYNVNYNITIKNYGNINLENVQVTDDLTAVFNAPASYTVVPLSVSSSGSVTPNSAFDGTLDKNLLLPGSTLAIGATANVQFTVNVVSNGNFGPFNNQANASAKGVASSVTNSDISTDGINPDTDGNGKPNESAATTVTLQPKPTVGAALAAGSPVLQANGSYNIPFSITLQNIGNVNLRNIQVVENIAASFPAPVTFTIVSAPTGSGNLTVNPGFNGAGNPNLLIPGSSTIARGAIETVNFTINVVPVANNFGPFNNQIFVEGYDVLLNQRTTDLSNNGTITDDGNKIADEPIDNQPTIVTLTPSPIIGLAKDKSAPILQANGSYDFTYTFTLKNYGNVELRNISVTDNLLGAFPNPAVVTVKNLTVTGSLIKNTAYNGVGNNNLLAAGSVLAVADTRTISLTLNVDPKGNFGPFNNSASTSATDISGTRNTNDVSQDGTNPDTDNDGNPAEATEQVATSISFTPNPIIGTSLAVTANVPQTDGSYIITYVAKLKNFGNIALENVALTQNFNPIFSSPATFAVTGSVLTDGNLIANPAFNGSSNFNLLAAGSTLAVGPESSVTFNVKVFPNGAFGPYDNQVLATAKGLAIAATANDASTNGTNADANNNGSPADDSQPTPVTLTPTPILGLAKASTVPSLQPDGTYLVTYTIKADNIGNVDLNNVQVTDDLNLTFPTPVTFVFSGTKTATGTFTINPAFNGNTDKNLLIAASSTIKRGTSESISFTLRITPNNSFGPFGNQAYGEGFGVTGGQKTSDLSNAGTISDDGNKIPNEPADNVKTNISLTPNPVLGLSETVSTPILNADGSYNVSYTVKVENLGNTVLNTLSLTNNLKATFGAPATYTVTNVSTSGGLVKATDFNGDDKLNLLAAGNTLAKGASGSVQIDLRIVPNGNFGPFSNITSGKAFDPALVEVNDISDAGTIADANNNGNPSEPGENDPVLLSLTPNPVIGVAKNVISNDLQADGSYLVKYEVVVKNFGNINLENIQVNDDLRNAFTGAATFDLVGAVTSTGSLVTNPAYDGKTTNTLLAAGSTLATGQTASIIFTVKVNGNGEFGPFNAQANATAKGLNIAITTSDISVNGTNPDANNDNNPNNDASPTPVTLTPNPAIGVAKAASAPVRQPDGSYNITYTVNVKNLGNVDLNKVQLLEDLTTTFPAPVTYTFVSAPSASGSLVVNPAYNGTTANANMLLSASSTLARGQNSTILFTLNVKPNGSFGPFENQINAEAFGVTGNVRTTDKSNSGNDADPNNNGNPNEAGEDNKTAVSLTPNPVIGIAKSVGAATLQSNGTYNLAYTIRVKNIGNIDLNNVQVVDNIRAAFPVPSVFTITAVNTTGTLVKNPAFNGNTNTSLLAAGTSLATDDEGTIVINLNVDANGNFGPFLNGANASATGTNGVATADVSDDGAIVDANGNGFAGDVGEDDKTSISLTPAPSIGAAMRVVSNNLQANGSYNVAYEINIKNLGNTDLRNITLNNDLRSVFTLPTTFTVLSRGVSGPVSVNPAYDAKTAANLLASGSQLNRGQSATIFFTLNIVANGQFGPFVSNATVRGETPDGLLSDSDISNDGTTIDPGNNNEASDAGENVGTPVSLSPNPVIAVAKKADAPQLQVDGSYNIRYTITVENIGNENLNNIQVTDDLSTTFPTPVTFSLVGTPTAGGSLSVNTSFTGTGANINLLNAASSSLNKGASQTISFIVKAVANGSFGPFDNSAKASGTGLVSVQNTSDFSVNGTDPDPNNNGVNDGDEVSPTPVSLTPKPQIGLAKAVSTAQLQPNGSYNLRYTFTVKNLGNIDLKDIQVTDNLKNTFGATATYTITAHNVTGSLVKNTAFNGNTDLNLLSTTSTLAVNDEKTVVLDLNVVPNGDFGPFANTASATAKGADNVPTADISDEGTIPDTDGNNDPSDSGEDDITLVSLTPNPVIGVAKSVESSILQSSGNYNITYNLTVKNFGNIKLTNVQVTDDLLTNTFTAPVTFTVLGGATATGNLAANTAYNGKTNTNLLNAAASSIDVGGSATIRFVVNVDPSGNFNPYFNSAMASATGSGTALTSSDVSVNGTDPDPDGDGNPSGTGENTGTPVNLTPNPVVGVAMTAVAPQLLSNGTYNVTYTVRLENLGNEDLNNVSVIENLLATFPAPVAYTLVGAPIAGNGLVVNPAFNGNSDTNLLTNTSTLKRGAKENIIFTLNLDPNGNFGPFNNSVAISGTGVTSLTVVSDISDNGNTSDPNGNGNADESGENDPTPITLTTNPLIGLAKAVSNPVLQSDGTYNITYIVIVENLGNTNLTNISVTDDLKQAFTAPAVYSIISAPSVSGGGLVPNAAFNGNSDINLLGTGSTLAKGSKQSISFTLNVDAKGNFGPYNNTAVISAKDANTVRVVTDISDNGYITDEDGDGDPSNTGENEVTPVLFTPNPVIGLSKSVGLPTLLPDGSYNLRYFIIAQNLGNIKLENISIADNLLAAFPGPSTFTVQSVTSSASLTVNPAYNGNSDQIMTLPASSTLDIGETQSLTLLINVKTNNNFGPFANSASANATGFQIATTASDISDDGAVSDANGNGNPSESGENDATEIILTPNPVIGVAKVASPAILKPDGSYDVTFTINVNNLGNVRLVNVQVLEDLDLAIAAPPTSTFKIQPIATGGFIINPAFDGRTNKNMLLPGSNLEIAESASIIFAINIKPNDNFGPFYNSVVASGFGETGGVRTADISDNGSDPDPNFNGKANDSDEDDTTPITLTPNPLIGLAKLADVPELQPDGSYNVAYTLAVKNIGNVILDDILVKDNLSQVIKAPATFTVIGAKTASGTLRINPDFDGSTDIDLLAPGSFLGSGSEEIIKFSINIKANGNFGPFPNSAIATATGRVGRAVTSDLSNNGNDVDPNNNGLANEVNENVPTPLTLTPNPVIGLAKLATPPIIQPDGSYNVSFIFTVDNLGNADLSNVQVSDDLRNQIVLPAVVTILNKPVSVNGLVVNPNYNGSTDINLLNAASSTLAVNASETLTLELNVKPNGFFGPFFNSALVRGEGPGGKVVSDLSNNGLLTDPNQNGNPGVPPTENQPTPVSFIPRPRIGIAKMHSSPALQPDNTYNITYSLKVKNYGNVDINNVSVSDKLSEVFGAPSSYTIINNVVASGSLTANPAYNGDADKELLTGGTLAVGQEENLSFTINVKPGAFFGPFNNTAVAKGVAVTGGLQTADLSQMGTNPDPDGDGNPAEIGENDPDVLNLTPNAIIGLAKSVATPVLKSNGTYDVVYTVKVKNYGNIRVTDLQITDDLKATFPAPVVFNVVGNPQTTSAGINVNNSFNGKTDLNLLVAGSEIDIAAEATISFTVNIKANGRFGPFNNSASASGDSKGGGTSDVSMAGNDPDPDNNGIPGEPANDVPTPLVLNANPVIGLAKAVEAPKLQANGSYNITYNLTVKNLGNVDVNNVIVSDNVMAAINAPSSYTMVGQPTATGTLKPNAAFNGNTDKALTTTESTLAEGETQTISFTINVVSNSNFGPFSNTATVNANSLSGGTLVTDISHTGVNPDPDGDNNANEADENLPTVVSLTPNSVIGLAKAVSAPKLELNGSYTFTYTLTVKNLGNVALANIQVSDDLNAVFPAPAIIKIRDAVKTTGTLVANANYNGTTATTLLGTGSTLPIGGIETVSFTVNVLSSSTYGTFNNSATAVATGTIGNRVTTDISQDGIEPDPNGNGNPSDNGEDKPTALFLEPTKVVIPEGFSPNNDGVNDKFIIENTGTDRINLEIYNRWGNIVYKSVDYKNDWDGRVNQGIHIGEDVPDGTYYYIAIVNNQQKFVSFITINR